MQKNLKKHSVEQHDPLFQGKSVLFIPGSRGLSHAHADQLGDAFAKAGGRVIKPEDVNKDNFKDMLLHTDYVVLPKTKSREKDLEKSHHLLKKAGSLKTFMDSIDEEGGHILFATPDWIQKCLKKNRIIEWKGYEVRAPLKEKQVAPQQHEEVKIEEDKPKEEKLQQSMGKSTTYDESPKMITPSTIKKRLFEEITPFTIPLDDRFNSILMATHNDLQKSPITLKRAPLNHELLEELELLRLELKTPEVQETMGKAIKFLKTMHLPIFDREEFLQHLTNQPRK